MAYVVGLTGGIACGKSTVARAFVAHGADLVDADVIAREVVEPGTSALAAIATEFGDRVIGPDGRLLRAELGALVFADKRALDTLNGLLHPEIERRIRHRVYASEAPVVVIDAALLVELGLAALCSLVVVVWVPRSVQIERLIARNGLTLREAEQRVASQSSNAERLSRSDVDIDNGAGLDELAARVAQVWSAIERAASNEGA